MSINRQWLDQYIINRRLATELSCWLHTFSLAISLSLSFSIEVNWNFSKPNKNENFTIFNSLMRDFRIRAKISWVWEGTVSKARYTQFNLYQPSIAITVFHVMFVQWNGSLISNIIDLFVFVFVSDVPVYESTEQCANVNVNVNV